MGITVGDIEIEALGDGLIRLPLAFFPGLDPEAHPDVLDEDGTVHVPTGAYLIRGSGRTILVDTGLGPREFAFPKGMTPAKGDPTPPMGTGGDLAAALDKAGCPVGEIDTVFLTHLHNDHIGWIAPEGELTFPGAQVVFGQLDWEALIEPAGAGEWGRVGMETARGAGLTEAISGDDVEIAPGIVARHAPGHTPGHYVLDITADDERLLLLGDVLHTPAQLTDTRVSFLSDVDPDLALRTRLRFLAEAEETGAIIAPAHFPDMGFLRL
ncbi:MBL fold metallo-hydrolase [Amycolatopsis speibonae]|uniref:MBL fold metallo-hydrolase n=1 Tax=Amycolatopsis speibonae TaxID=1450224 RepID=A0ABV7NZB1_9PSEU